LSFRHALIAPIVSSSRAFFSRSCRIFTRSSSESPLPQAFGLLLPPVEAAGSAAHAASASFMRRWVSYTLMAFSSRSCSSDICPGAGDAMHDALSPPGGIVLPPLRKRSLEPDPAWAGSKLGSGAPTQQPVFLPALVLGEQARMRDRALSQ